MFQNHKRGLGHEQMVPSNDDFGIVAEWLSLNPLDEFSDSFGGAAKYCCVIGPFRRIGRSYLASLVQKASGKVGVDCRDGHREWKVSEGVQNTLGVIEYIGIGNAWAAAAVGFSFGFKHFFDVIFIVEFVHAVCKEKGTRGTESCRRALDIVVSVSELVQDVVYSGEAVKEGFASLSEIVHDG